MSSSPLPAGDPNALSDADHALLRRLLHERSGILLDPSRESFAEMRLGALATEIGLASPAEVVEALRTEESWGVLHRLVVESLAVTETSWFRDAGLWDELRQGILPGLIERRRDSRQLTIWSAACSTGQEPYSLAMLLQDRAALLTGWRVQLIATDFSHRALKRAGAAAYNQMEMNRGLPASMLVRHFRKHDDDWELRPEVRKWVEFRELNLSLPWPPLPPLDLVLMRNVLIYFEPPLRRRVLRQLAPLLKPDGALVLGAGETTLTMDDSYDAIPQGRTVIYRRRAGLF